MSKQKRKLKKNQVALDNKIYDINHPAYGDIYENKIATGEVYWDEDSQQWLTTSPAVYVSPPKWNKKLSREKNEKIYQKWQEKNDPDYVANQVRKGTGSVARPLLDAGLEMTGGAGTYRFAQDPLKNLQGTANVLSYANLPGLAMHGLDYMQGKPFFNVTSEDLEGLGNTFDVAGLATLGAAPLIKQGLKVAPKILSSTSKGLNQGTKTLVRELTKNRMPDIPGTVSQSGFSDLFGLLKKSKFKNKESIDYVKNVTSDPRYAQKAKELDVKYSVVPTQERPVSNNSTLTDQQQTTGFNPFIQQLTRQQTGARRTQRNNPYRPSQMFGPIQDGHLFEDAAGPFTRMSNYTQTPNYYDKIFTNFNFGDEYLKKLNKNVDDLTPAEFEKFTKEQRKSGTFYMGKEDIQISPNKEEAIAHELKHKEHFNRKWEPTFPKKYTEEISKNFDKTGYPSEYTQYRLTDTEQEAWLSRDLKKSMVDKGYLKTPFDEIDEATLDKFIKQDNKIFTPELLKRLNKPNFLNWVNEALPAATGVTTVGAIGSQLMSQEESAPEQKAYGGKINNMKKNKLPKYQTGGPVDPILSNRLMQYLFGRNNNKPSILDARSPNEYGVSFGDRFNIQSGLSFDPMRGMPSGYGKVGINNKGFNLGLEKRKGQSTFNVGYDSPNFNIGATYSNTNKMPSIGGNVGFNTKGFNVGASGNYSPNNKNIGANIGYNNKGFNAGLNYDYSGQSSLSGNVGYGNDLFNVGLSGNYSPGDANVNLNTTYNLGIRNKQKKEPIPLAFNTPEEIQMIKEDIDSNEAVGPPKKSYGGKITNMKKKNNLPKLAFGAPQLFDLAANTLINGTTYAVTDMIKAIREPEQEMRPTKRNTGMVMENGGTVGGPKKKKKIKFKKNEVGKEYDINSPEYRELYNSGLTAVDADGVPIVYQGSDEAWNKEFEKQRKKKGENAVRKGTGKFVKETAKLLPANPNEPDSFVENALEIFPSPLGRLLSADDMLLAGHDLATDNKQGYLRNTLDLASPFLKIGDNPVNPQLFSQVANYYRQVKGKGQPILDALPFVANQIPNAINYGVPIGGFADDVYQDNIAPMLPSKNKKSTPQNNNNFATDEEKFAMGGMIKRADGSYSKRGLWDNIRANKGSGKKPTKQMLEQERKINSEMAFGGMIDPSMYMQQMMYGSYAQGGQVPQNIPVEVEGGEAYELPNGEMGEFEGPSHDNGGIPVALPEQTKVYSKQLKVNGKTMADRKTKREANVAKLEKILSKNPSDKFIKEALKRQQETAALEEQSDMAMQEQANQKQQMQQQPQQGMMQEQMMAGMMQDPAMMQQMGMMMYGGKLANGSPGTCPEGQYWNGVECVDIPNSFSASKTIESVPNTRFQKRNNKWKGITIVDDNSQIPPSNTPNHWYDQNGEVRTRYNMIDGRPLSDEEQTNRAFDEIGNVETNPEIISKLNNELKGEAQYYEGLTAMQPMLQLMNPFINQNFEQNYNPSPTVNDFGKGAAKKGISAVANRMKRLNTSKNNNPVLTPLQSNVDNQAALQQLQQLLFPNVNTNSKIVDSNISLPKPEVTDIAPPYLTEEQLNQFTNFNTNPLDLRKNVGVDVTKPEPPGVNPYDVMSNMLGNTFGNIALSKDPYINTKGGMIPNPLYNEVIGNKMLPEEDPKKPNKFMNFLNNAVDQTGDFFSGIFDKSGKPKKEKTKKGETKVDGDLPFTRGDLMGMAGTKFGALAPMTTTMLNRMMTPKNQNFFREYGAEGLRAMQEAQALSGINRDKQLADIKMGEEASRQRGRNSARGVNTLRAMDISSDIAANQAQNQAYNSYAQQMMQLLGQKGQMENQQDQMVMQGEYNRDLADRQDVDQFYTNLAENFASQSELMQKQGRDMNQAQYNKMILEMSPMFSKYGIGVSIGENGKITYTWRGEKVDETTARLKMQEELKKEAEQKKAGTTTPTTTTTAPVNSNVLPAINPLGLGNTPYFNPIFKDLNIPTVTDKSLTKAATKRR